ncbi:MAG: hypothetical protein COB14_09320 [Alphaproteobacteria bacterium]|nr:MAG: hypothetical protein COB14_09320 [Alphaproteobacteria bacterium]
MTNTQTQTNRAIILSPFTVRLTDEEWVRLRQDAANKSLSDHARWCLFEKDVTKRRKQSRLASIEEVQVAQLLGELKRTRMANNLNQLAKAVNSGLLILPEDDKAVLLLACAHIYEMRHSLVKALGQA